MRRLLLVLGVLSFVAVVNAQETPKYELFGGYSFLRESATNYNGWEGSGAYNFNPWIGFKLDADGHYLGATTPNPIFFGDQTFYQIMGGPPFSWRPKPFPPFSH